MASNSEYEQIQFFKPNNFYKLMLAIEERIEEDLFRYEVKSHDGEDIEWITLPEGQRVWRYKTNK
jgi:hypothetical protein